MLGTLVGLATWAIGDILVYRGPLSGLRAILSAGETSQTIPQLIGSAGWIILSGLELIAIFWLLRASNETRNQRGKLWGWLPLGIVVGVIISLSWLFANAGGTNYPYGTSNVPTGIYLALFENGLDGSLPNSPWIPIALVSLIPGALIAAIRSKTLWIRGEDTNRYLQLGAGGFLMGVGAAFAGGCNLGHSLVGVPLLSVGSISTTLAMAAGVFLADRLVRLLKTA